MYNLDIKIKDLSILDSLDEIKLNIELKSCYEDKIGYILVFDLKD